MITTRDSTEFASTKQEKTTSDNNIINKICKANSSSSSITSWSRLKDPRIVRVSRAFGGKDRHSKVCTVRGLRDRRVRLSVPTAIQLYDLQDRLGLNQPSKVVDWLLDAAKHEIDELPPLQMPPSAAAASGNSHYTQALQTILSSTSADQKEKLKINRSCNWDDRLEPSISSSIWNSDHQANLREKCKEAEGEAANNEDHKDENWGTSSDQGAKQCNPHAYVSSNNLFSRLSTNSPLPGLSSNAINMHYSSFLRWDPSNLSLSHSSSHGLSHQPEDFHSFNGGVSGTPLLGSQVLVYPPGISNQSGFSSHVTTPGGGEFDPKQLNFQMLNSGAQNPLSNSFAQPLDHQQHQSTSQSVRPFHFSMATKLASEPDKDN